MNAIGMVFQQPAVSNAVMEQKQTNQGSPASSFQDLLSGSLKDKEGVVQVLSDNETNQPSDVQELLDGLDMDLKSLSELLKKLGNLESGNSELLKGLSKQLVELFPNVDLLGDAEKNALVSELNDQLGAFLQNTGNEKLINEVSTNLVDRINGDDVIDKQSIQSLFATSQQVIEDIPRESSSNIALLANYLVEMNPQLSNEEIQAIQKQFADILAKADEYLQKLNQQELSLTKAAPKLLDLLKEWQALEKSISSNKEILDGTKGMGKEGTKEAGVWKDLLQWFQKRTQMGSTSAYNQNAQVTTTDVRKWLEHALGNQSNIEATAQSTVPLSAMPISKVEQFVIHVNQTQSSQPVEQQVMDQVQKIIKTSKFSTLPNGTNQLNIAMRPENLGEMMVKLTQINGEMTVKISVTSQATKELLESNINQLRNMFSPNQVVIERQDVNSSQQGQDMQQGEDEQPLSDQSNESFDESEQDDEQQEQDFETTFQDILMNDEM